MRTPHLLTTLLAAGTLLAGCYKQPLPTDPAGSDARTLTLTAVLEDGAPTKVDISSATGAATWSSGDQVAYCITDGSTTQYNTSTVDVSTGRISLTIPAGYQRTGYAIYPASAKGTDLATPTVFYPAAHDLSGQTAETFSPCPMVALNTESELHFYHVGGLLRLHLGAIPDGTRSLRLTFRGVDYVTGTFTVSGAGTAGAACTKSGTDGGNTLTFTLGGDTDFPASTFLNVPLPGVDYTSLKELLIHCLDAAGNALCTLEKHVTIETAVDRAEGFKMHLGAGNRKMHDFSVAAGRKVKFSPGNLQATTTDLGATWTWAFAANQWSVVGNAAGNNSINGVGTVSTNGTVDLFGWNGKSSSNNTWGINNSTSNADYGNNASDVLKTDWGSIPGVISDLGAGWRTPSSAEWVYLFDTRTTSSGVRYAKATVNGVAGVILLPDDWSTSYYTLRSTNSASAALTANTISLSDWTSSLEAHGAVFLPAAGYRDGTSIGNVGSLGSYWSSTAYSTTGAYDLSFNSSSVNPQLINYRYFGFAVRLVRDANPFLFSISDSAKAEFSPGNLQYQASTKTWRFAEHQWDCVGSTNSSISSSYSGWIDLFGWGTSGHAFASGYGSAYQPWSTSTTTTDYGPTDGTSGLTGTYKLGDWGVQNTIGSYPAGTWRTPTSAEWGYLFNTRATASGIRYAKATVNGVAGMILLPDNWSDSYYTLSSANTADAAFTANTISLSDWTSSLEAHGAIFLPAAGYRHGTGIRNVGISGSYWSSTANSTTFAYYLDFYSSNVYPQFSNNRLYGFAVRLIRTSAEPESEPEPLPGTFTVSSGKTVHFSPGNLQATTTNLGSSWTWSFAANQWDYVGNAAANTAINGVKTVSTNGTVDLFGWNGASSTNDSYGINNSENDANYGNNASDGLKTDWGFIPEVISTLGSGWRTLSNAEWGYLFNTRTTTSGIRYAKATVNGVTGMILLPDDWSTSYYTLSSTNSATAGYVNTISASDWTSKLEAHGAVFFPAAGYRYGTTVNNAKNCGYYYSSTANSSTRAYFLYFSNSKFGPQYYDVRLDGCSVRLVR